MLLMNEKRKTNAPYGEEAVRGVAEFYEACRVRSERGRRQILREAEAKAKAEREKSKTRSNDEEIS